MDKRANAPKEDQHRMDMNSLKPAIHQRVFYELGEKMLSSNRHFIDYEL